MKPLSSAGDSPRRTVAIGVVAATLTVGAAGAAFALASRAGDSPQAAADATASPEATDATSRTSQDPAEVAALVDDLGDSSDGGEHYTQERSDAFWDAGYQMEDAAALAELWQVPILEAKGRAGQMLLDGQQPPIGPRESLDMSDPATIERLQGAAFWDAGYTGEDGERLAELWDVDVFEAKFTAGKMLYEGKPLPIEPSGTPAPYWRG